MTELTELNQGIDTEYFDASEKLAHAVDRCIEREEPITVEFGPGAYPIFPAYEDGLYVGVNIDSRQHKYFSERFTGANCFGVLWDVRETLPEVIPNGIVDTVVLSNVLGETRSDKAMKTFYNDIPEFNPGGDDYRGGTDDTAKDETLAIAAQLLRPGGEMVIVETISPGIASMYKLGSYFDVADFMLQRYGLEVVEYLERGDDKFEDELACWRNPTNARAVDGQSFILKLAKR